MYNKENWNKQNILAPERITAQKAASMMLDFLFLPETESIPEAQKIIWERNQRWLHKFLEDKKIFIQGSDDEYVDCLRMIAK